MKALTFNIKAHTYPFIVRVIIGKDLQTVVDYINTKQHRKGSDKYKVNNLKGNLGRYCPHDIYRPVIWMPAPPRTARQLCTAAHEILHAVFDCMEYIGAAYSRQSEETFTYLQAHLMKQFLKKCGYK